MKILVVDNQAEAAESLAQSLRELTGCTTVAAVGSEGAAAAVSDGGVPEVLVTESVLGDTDGFTLREAIREHQPALRTIFVTEYDLSEYQEYLDGAAVFYKPVDPKALLPALALAPRSIPAPVTPEPILAAGPSTTSLGTTDQRSQSARLRKLVGKQGFTGKLDQFDLVDIIQLCCISKRTGRLQIARGVERGVLYLRNGQIIHAVSGELVGDTAAYEIIGWSSGQFSFDDSLQPEEQTIQSGWEHLVMEAVRQRDERTAAQNPGDTGVPEDPGLAGKTIGPYQLRRKIGQGTRSEVFEAVQMSMDRVVALKILSSEFQGDEHAVQNFLANASAKANVQHPSILSVYEAGHDDGIYYYAREFVDGVNLSHLHAEGRVIDDATALQCIKVAAESLSYLNQQKVAHPPVTADDLYLGRDGRARLNNLATLPDVRTPATQQDIRALSRMVSECLPNRAASSHGLRDLLGRMLLEGAVGFLSWGALLQGVKALEPKVVPEDAFKLNARDLAAKAAVQDAKRRQKRALILTTLGMVGVFWVVAAVVYVKFFRVTAARSFDHMVTIPAGPFIYQAGEHLSTGAYWIDEYEVTISQYEKFLNALQKTPTNQYEAPNVPQGHRHDNVQWGRLYAVAKTGGLYNGAPVDLNCPAVFVDWFDAYAYAKWKGHRLPTEQEWEKAGRGPDGFVYPWGNDPQLISKVNTSADFHEDGAVKGDVDGYNRWSPVDAMTGDKSPYGVMDMAGNVSEWTADVLPGKNGMSYPVICGGNFGSATVELTHRVTVVRDFDTSERVGFRTVSDSAPPAP